VAPSAVSGPRAGYRETVAEKNGYERELAEYEAQLAQYLQQKIKPGLSRSTIPLVARSIAKEIARREPPEPPESHRGAEGERPEGGGKPPDFEAEMHDLQAELGEDWVLRFSVHDGDAWLTAEKPGEAQHVEAPDAQGLLPIVEAINEGGGRRR
jgi:hypothetical protein